MQLDLLREERRQRRDLSALTAPTVVIVGERSRAQDAREVVAAARKSPNAEVVLTPGGHGLPADLAERLNADRP
ncbi:alpha/beta fold hydrolase [Saccharothrix australiensis]|uniref:alpha/beta fold hydrolase n=1 Tax=Saccharothrix australiensis TaxID=2072 RepID=UPI001B87E797|nr:hypothetical protein [Saccharothrix australiensis]